MSASTGSATERARSLLAQADAHVRGGSVDAAWRACLDAATIGRECGDATILADAATVIGDPELGPAVLAAQRHALCREALALLGDADPQRSARLRSYLRITRSPWLSDVEPPPETMGDAAWGSDELHARHQQLLGIAHLDDRLRLADELAALAIRTGRAEDSAWASLWRADALLQAGRRPEFDAEITRLTAIVHQLASPTWRWRLAAVQASVALLDGHVGDVVELTAAARRLGAEAGVDESRHLDLILRSSLAVRTGVGLEEIEREVRRATAGLPYFAKGWHAQVLLAAGRVDEAITIWRSLANHLTQLPQDAPEWLIATAGHAVLCAAARDEQAAVYLTGVLLPYADRHATGGAKTPYEGPVALYLGILARVTGDLTAARAHLRRAIHECERIHSPLFAATARAELAALYDSFNPLTEREHEVAQLAARGLTNVEIADRLVLSRRTVENHIASALRKLGIPNRAAIANRLAEGGAKAGRVGLGSPTLGGP